VDIRDEEAVTEIFRSHGTDISLIIHVAAQPSHDWAVKEPFTDFTVNANGTLMLLECTRRYCREAVFIFLSTNKVYGDTPNYTFNGHKWNQSCPI
jgi:CDP-paratose 2-epimerase